jgi:branched-chain amino acid transport system permease protein
VKQLAAFAVIVLVLAGLNAVLPSVLNPYFMRVLMLCGISIVLAVSLNLVNGFTGQFSIGHAGFMAVGAYTAAMFSLHVGVGWVRALEAASVPAAIAEGAALLVALLLGGAAAAVAGYLVGLPSLRLRGDYLAIVTLGFGEIIRVIITNVDAVGAARGLPGIPAWANFFWVGLAVTAVVLVAKRLANSTHGRALFAIRDDEVAAEALGVDTTRYKVLAFVISSFFAGLAGGLFAQYNAYLHPNSFTFLKSIEVIAMIVLGGLGSISGAILGAVVLTVLPEALRSAQELRMVIYSLMLIILMITRPGGLLGSRELNLTSLFRKRAPGRA